MAVENWQILPNAQSLWQLPHCVSFAIEYIYLFENAVLLDCNKIISYLIIAYYFVINRALLWFDMNLTYVLAEKNCREY
jgi:hypothetical protein